MSTRTLRHELVSKTRRDYAAWSVGIGAAIISAVAFVVTYRNGGVLTYNDAISHLEISRRVVAGSNNGLAQLGSVWLPLPHVLSLPLVWIDPLYYSGFAGAIVSMVAFVVATVFVYKIVTRLLIRRSTVSATTAGVAGALVFALNINVLYMQSTPMTEMLLFATLLGSVYYLMAWADDERRGYLTSSAVWGMLATLTRYESWPVVIVLMLSALIIAWRRSEPDMSRRTRGQKLQEVAIVYGAAALAGIIMWMLWSRVLFGSFFSFRNGEYAKPALWLTNNEPSIGNLWVSIKTFGYAFLANVPWLLAAVAGVGLVAYLACERLKSRTLPVLALLVIVPFMVWAIYTGERPLHVEQIYGDLYNVRFGLVMVLPTAIFVGYLVGLIGRVKMVAIALAVVTFLGVGVLTLSAVRMGEIITLKEPSRELQKEGSRQSAQTAQAFRRLYDGGDVLMESFGNERLGFEAVPSQARVYEGTNKLDRWKRSLADPYGMKIRWIIVRCKPGADKVCQEIQRRPEMLNGYAMVYQHPSQAYSIYRVNN